MFWTLAGNVVFAGTQWAMLMALARLGNPSDLGLYTLALALTTPVFLLLSLQLRGAQATEPQNSPYRFGHYWTLRLGLSLLALLLCGGYAWKQQGLLAPVVVWLALAKLFDGLSDVCYGYWQARRGLDQVARSLMLRGVLSAALMTLAFWQTHAVTWAAVGTATGYLMILLLYDLPLTRRQTGSSWRVKWTELETLIRLTWPLGLAVALISLNASLPRYFLGHTHGLGAVGVFSALSYVTVAGSMVATALGQAVTTPLARQIEAGDLTGFRRLLIRMLLAGAGLGLLGILVAAVLGAPLLDLLYGPAYAQQAPLFLLLMVGGGISYVASFAGFGMTALREFAVQVPLFLVTTGGLLLWCWLLIPAYGLSGAAWATALGAAIQLIGSLWIVVRRLRLSHALLS